MKFLILCLLFVACNGPAIHPIRGDIVEAVYGLGTVESEDVFHAKAAIVTSVDEFFVTEGQDVVKGQKLFRTDQGSVTTAPFDGRVTEIPVSIRENLFPQSPVLTLINLRKLYLEVSLEQQGAMRIRPGVKAEISFEFFRNKKIKGTIATVYPQNDQFIAKVVIEEWPEGVLPGMTADVAFEVARKLDVTLVPVKAIVNGHLRLKRAGKKIKLPVQVGLVDLEKAEILSPALEASDELILP